MNDQQFTSLVLACALVMVPLGIALALLHRQWWQRLVALRPPRFLIRLPVRRRKGGPR